MYFSGYLLPMEAVAEMTTIVFDKTGTLTKGEFKVAQIQPQGMTETELLEIAALGEGYSTHPIANSIREAYGKTPDMKRTENANEIAGHGISITVDNKAMLIGNETDEKGRHRLHPLPERRNRCLCGM